ncbi:MAG TPA: hypothetical protein VML57_20405 [Burkholderiales bacterium]|nr:hypothetical protein [Burkholderiales bacterium]
MLGIALEVKDHAVRFGAGRAARYLAWRVADRLAGYMPYQGFILRARPEPAPVAVCRLVLVVMTLQSLATVRTWRQGDHVAAREHEVGIERSSTAKSKDFVTTKNTERR